MASHRQTRNENGTHVSMRSSVLKLKPLDGNNRSSLLLRRTSRKSFHHGEILTEQNIYSDQLSCSQCQRKFSPEIEIFQSGGQFFHKDCFVCAQCFQPFPDGIFYEFENRRYCNHDFNVLFAPSCERCKEFIAGRVIKAMNASWHPGCFVCKICNTALSETGFVKNANRALCRDCNTKEKEKGLGKYFCFKCHQVIDEGPLKYKSEVYHPYHFNCVQCNTELKSDAREVNGELLCLCCFDRTKVAICGACRRPVEDRVVYALGKAWHAEHFVCTMCEKPFHGTRHYEKRDKAYCKLHYYQLFGDTCFLCNSVIVGDVFSAMNKTWCIDHFSCSFCDKKMNHKTKFLDFDKRPICKKCFKHLPSELRKRLEKECKQSKKKKVPTATLR